MRDTASNLHKRNPMTVSHNIQVEAGATANTEMAICSTILLGKVDAAGSYNVNGHVVSIEELQQQLRNSRDRN